MKYKKLGRTGMTVSRLCLGTGNWGYSDEPYGNWATTNEKEAFKIMDAALDAGVNFFDCANVYGNHGSGTTGTSEEIIGKWFRLGGGRREKVILGTKVGREMYNNDYDGPNRPEGLSLYKIRRHAEGSLQRLGTDHIELYQMHNVDRTVNWDELWEAFEGLVRSGKVYYVGASKFAGWELMKAQEAARRRNFMGLACEQHRYDPLRRAAELEAFPCCIDQGIGVTLYSPLQRGLLGYDVLEPNRTLTYEATLDLEKYRPQLTEYAKLCHDLGESVANVTLAWEMHHPAVTAPVIGPASLKDFEEMLRSVEIELTDDVLAEIDRIFPPLQSLFYNERPDNVRPISWN